MSASQANGLGSAKAPEPSGLGPTGAIPSAVWAAGELRVQTDEGAVSLPAWMRGSFALDFRIWDLNHPLAYEEEHVRGWQLTHIPTGYKICGLLLPIDEAKEAVEELEAVTDWSFSDPAAAKGKAELLSPLRQKLGDKILFKDAAFTPLPISIPASVGRNAERQDREDGLGPKDEHAVGSVADETPDV